jgi:hypothetical protein
VNGRRIASIVPPKKFATTSFAARPNVRPPTPPTPRMLLVGMPSNATARATELRVMIAPESK